MNTQAAFAHALLDPALSVPASLTSWNGSDPGKRFAVYRNNVTLSLIAALADTFPVVQELVGGDFFHAMAKVFVQTQPPRTRLMVFYGADFADFVASFAPAASLRYLADVARLEMSRVQACHAADLAPIAPNCLQAAWADPQGLASLRFALHPSLQVIESVFAICSLWAAHQGVLCISSVDPEVAQTALVFRNGLDVEILEIATPTGRFISALQGGATLLQAIASASSADPEFDLSKAMALLIHHQLITHINSTSQ